jgi:hypothetical protein
MWPRRLRSGIGFRGGRQRSRKDLFFFEKKNQKTFALSRSPPSVGYDGLRENHRIKVFWFFFSKKNILPFVPEPIR